MTKTTFFDNFSQCFTLDYSLSNKRHQNLNPDYAVGIVTRVEKPQRNEKLERFCAEGIFVNMLRSKIVKSRQG
ncbi:MAG: hypothetical protein R6T98_16870, partial [Desulfatiglandales bacterium]